MPQVVCEFLEVGTAPAAAAQQQQQQQVDPLIIVAAVRLLGSFLAEAPDMHASEVRRLLPRLLAMQATSTGGSGSSSGSGSATATERAPPASWITFLLPAMLQWTAPHNPQQQQWVACMLDPSSGCLAALAAAVTTAAAGAAAAAAAAAGDGSGGAAAPAAAAEEDRHGLQAAEMQLGTACQVLAQLLSSVRTVLRAGASTQRHAHASASQAAAGRPGGVLGLGQQQQQLLAAALQPICSWAGVRQHQHERALQDNTVAAAAAAVALHQLAGLQQVGLELSVLLRVAALAGQLLLTCAQPQLGPALPAGTAAAAAALLCWGCCGGWCYRVAAAAGRGAGGARLLRELGEEWDAAELEEVWEACLMAAAELLVGDASARGGGGGGCVGRALTGAGWLRLACADAPEAADVLRDSVGLQLLAQAAREQAV
jgi:hypothetical protein